MQRYSFILFPFFSLILSISLFSQEAEKVMSVKNFKFTENVEHIHSKLICIKPTFNVHFNWSESNRDYRKFKLYWVLKDEQGNTVFDCRNEKSIFLNYESLTPNMNVEYMEDKGVYIHIPNKSINLPEGTHTLSLVFSAKGKLYEFPDFHTEKITIHQQSFSSHTLEEQGFSIKNLEFLPLSKGFGVNDPGLTTRFDLGLTYGPDHAADVSYYLRWEFQNLAGTTIFSSSRASSIHHKDEAIYLKNYIDKTNEVELFTQYGDIELSGSSEVQFVLFATLKSGASREIYREKLKIDLPDKHDYKDQEFSMSDTEIGHYDLYGTLGIRLTSTCKFKYDGPLENKEDGDKYRFKLTFQDEAGNNVFLKNDYSYIGNFNSDKQSLAPKYQDPIGQISLFYPYRRMNLPPGDHTLTYTVGVSNKSGNIKFPDVLTGTLEVSMPEVHEAEVKVTELFVYSGDYDTKLENFGNALPDPMWVLKVGNETFYKSSKRENSLEASGGTATFAYAVGEKVRLNVLDHDRGFFNPNDLIESISLLYQEKGDTFSMTKEEHGKVSSISLTWKKLK